MILAQVMKNTLIIGEFVGILALFFIIAYVFEKMIRKKQGDKGRILNAQKISMIGLFSGISAILMMFEFPLPFAPGFYELDFSEVPVLVITFAFGPVAGVLTEFCKILLKLLFKSTSTAFIGDLSNFVIGCSFILPAGLVYSGRKTKGMAMVACIVGTLVMTVFGSALNAVYLIPTYAVLFKLPIEVIVDMGAAINPNINSVTTLVLFAVVPFNIVKGVAVSLITILLYKKLSPILKSKQL